MALIRRREERIRGVAGSMEGMTVLLFDGATPAGPGIARVLAEAGARVCLASSDRIALELQLAALRNMPGETVGLTVDGSTANDMLGICERFEHPPDAAVIGPAVHDHDTSPPIHASILARTVADGMRDRGVEGSIVLVTGIPRSGTAHSASAYLDAEMRLIATEYAANAIRVNSVAPGHVAVNRRGHSTSSGVSRLGHKAVHPVEVGKAVWFLLNPNLSSGITGTTLKIDRGASLLLPDW